MRGERERERELDTMMWDVLNLELHLLNVMRKYPRCLLPSMVIMVWIAYLFKINTHL